MPTHTQRFAALALTVLSTAASAATTYTSSAAFLPNVAAGRYTETFASSSSFSLLSSANFSGGGFAYTVAATGTSLYGNDAFLGTNGDNAPLVITFTGAAVTAVGGNFFVTNGNDAFQPLPVTVGLSDGTTTTFSPATLGGSYRGYTSTVAITSLTLAAPGAARYINVDNLTVGSAVPEPGTWLLLGLGIGALAWRRARAGAAS